MNKIALHIRHFEPLAALRLSSSPKTSFSSRLDSKVCPQPKAVFKDASSGKTARDKKEKGNQSD
jgi:hypothetical protein